MMDAFGVFTDPRFDSVFSQTASLQGAKDEVYFDVESLHADARKAICTAVKATREGNPDPNARIALILGEAGFGKTHLLAASLRKLAVEGQLYPAVLQMTSPVTDENYEQWMLEAVIRELNNPYFAIPRLNKNVLSLLHLLPSEDRAQFRQAVQNEDSALCERLGHEFAPRIREEWIKQAPDQPPPSEEQLASFLIRRGNSPDWQPPLMDLAYSLLTLLAGEDANMFRASAEAGDERFLHFVPTIAQEIRRVIRDRTNMVVGEPFLKALLLHYGGNLAGYDALSGHAADAGVEGLTFAPLTTAELRRRRLGDISVAARAVDGAFVLAFDQLESFWSLANEALYIRAIEKAVNLVQEFPNISIVLASLRAVYDQLHDKLVQSIQDRIRLSLAPTHLTPPNPEQLRSLFEKRMAHVAGLAGMGNSAILMQFVPDWLIEGLVGIRIREALSELARFRAVARQLGRLPEEEEFFDDGVSTAPAVSDEPQRDYDKEWQDHLDQRSSLNGPRNDEARIELLYWAIEAAAPELAPIKIRADLAVLPDENRTSAIQLIFDNSALDRPDEMRLVGLCTAPNRDFRLARQIENVHRHAGAARAVVIGKQRFPKGKNAQVAAPLDRVRNDGGIVADFAPLDWEMLATAREFIEAHKHEPGFEHWQGDTRFLLNRVVPLRAVLLPAIEFRALAEPAEERPAANGTAAKPVGQAQHAVAALSEPRRVEADPAGDGGAAELVNGVAVSEDMHGAQPYYDHDAPAQDDEDEAVELAEETCVDRFRVFLGTGASEKPIYWDPHHPRDKLLNFGFLVTGDPGSGKTQTLRVVIDAMARQGYPICILDFKNDYADPAFSKPLGLSVYNVSRGGLPFNPLRPVPDGSGETQPIRHIHTIAEVFQRVFGLGTQQQARLKNALKEGFQERGIDLQAWYRAEDVSAPGFDEIVEILRAKKDSQTLLNRVDPLFDLGLFPSDETARLTFADLLERRVVLDLHDLPNDEIKAAIAEMIIIQAHGYALRGEAPRVLRRLFVFDEAWRVKDSKRLEEMAREGRAFGIAIAIGTQFPVDIPDDLAGSLETQLFLSNSEARHQAATVRKLCGSASTSEAQGIWQKASNLQQLQGFMRNQHYKPYVLLDVYPHYLRNDEN